MTHLSNCLKTLMEIYKINASEMARSVEMSPSMFSRLLSGERLPSHETLRLLLSTVPRNKKEARDILRAHILDEVERLNAKGLASVYVGEAADSPETEHLFEAITESIVRFYEVAELARDIASLSEKYAARIADSSGGKIVARAVDAAIATTKAEPHTIKYPLPNDTPARRVAEEPSDKSKKKPR